MGTVIEEDVKITYGRVDKGVLLIDGKEIPIMDLDLVDNSYGVILSYFDFTNDEDFHQYYQRVKNKDLILGYDFEVNYDDIDWYSYEYEYSCEYEPD